MSLFYFKLDLLNLPSMAKVIENRNFKHTYLGTMILCLQIVVANKYFIFLTLVFNFIFLILSSVKMETERTIPSNERIIPITILDGHRGPKTFNQVSYSLFKESSTMTSRKCNMICFYVCVKSF